MNRRKASIAASSQEAISTGTRRAFLLVHGAWHGGWCWNRVADILRARGHRVFAPSLTGLGDRAHLFSIDITLKTHVDDVLSVIEAEELSDFVLVGHSYGGIVISFAADALGSRVAHYVYLDATVPRDMSPGASFSWSDSDIPENREARLKSIREEGGGVALPAPPAGAFGVTGPEDAAWLQRKLLTMPARTYTEPCTFRNSGSNGCKRTYIASIKPSYSLLVPTHDRVRNDSTWSFVTIHAGHDSMITAPHELASLLLSISLPSRHCSTTPDPS